MFNSVVLSFPDMAARSSVALLDSSLAIHHHRVSSHCRAPCAGCRPLASHGTLKPCQHRSVLARSAENTDVVVDELIQQASDALVKAREALADVQRAEEFLATTSAPTFIPTTLTFGAPLSEQSDKAKSGSDAPGGGSAAAQSKAAPARGQPPTDGSTAPAVRPIPVPGARSQAVRPAPAPSGGPSAVSSAPSSGTAVQTAPPAPAPSAQGDQPWGDATDSHEAPTMILQRQRVRKRRNNNQTEFAEPNSVQELSFPLQASPLFPSHESNIRPVDILEQQVRPDIKCACSHSQKRRRS